MSLRQLCQESRLCRRKKEKNKILAVVGSVNPNTTVQMEELWLSQRTHNVFVKTRELLKVMKEENRNCPCDKGNFG